MTNQELYIRMKEELPHYQIGFHQISLQKYQSIVGSGFLKAQVFKIDGENVDEKTIANRIMQKGFQIWDSNLGLSSTTYFPKTFLPEKLDYKYYHRSSSTCNIIFAIPYFFTYEGRTYFIGNLSMALNVSSRFIFNEGIPSSFVYGYYERETPVGFNPYHQQFSEELSFYQNDGFWDNLSVEEQKQILKKIFDEKRKNKVLRLANNHSQLGLLKQDRLSRILIRETRRQKKIYVKSLKR